MSAFEIEKDVMAWQATHYLPAEPGLWSWPGFWKRLEQADRAALDRFREWTDPADQVARKRCADALNVYVRAGRDAAAEWEREGRP